MNWIFIALISGNLVTSQHQNEEACLGRKAMFEKEHKVSGKCFDLNSNILNSNILYSTNSSITSCCAASGICQPCK